MATNMVLYKGKEKRNLVKGGAYEKKLREAGWADKVTRANANPSAAPVTQPAETAVNPQ